jgi:menaquinol-cytochrome c reductase iron-sulfur subunit
MKEQESRLISAEGMGRRGFIKRLLAMLSAPIAVFLGWPFLSSLIRPVYRVPEAKFVKVGGLDSLPLGKPKAIIFEMLPRASYIHSKDVHTVWAIKHSDSKVTVFSPICTHLGCHFHWFQEAEKFICPCHGSVYSIDGKVLAGPAPRSLDTLPTRIENGDLYVKWELFEVGVPGKIMIG